MYSPQLIDVDWYHDNRGSFCELFNYRRFLREFGVDFEVKQSNLSISSKHVFRGLHFQHPTKQMKVVHCVSGEIIDVVVNLDCVFLGEPLKVEFFHLNPRVALTIPSNFAHGFYACTDTVIVNYLVDQFYSPADEFSLDPRDPQLNISDNLPLEKAIFSQKDLSGYSVDELRGNIFDWFV